MPARPDKFLCGVPEGCSGGIGNLSGGLKGKNLKVHSSPGDAFDCHAAYLIRQGYTQLRPREYASPIPGEPVRVLTRRGKFGARMRPGKENRNMPSERTGGTAISM